ncbi:MAG: hypothetical protein QM726_01185 [Chitinophagaceae bacterium]
MKALLGFLMPLLMVVSFIISSKLFAKDDYLTSAVFTLASYSAASLWIAIIGSKKLMLR